MRVVCLSDTHSQLGGVLPRIPEGDILIHAGDLTWQGTPDQIGQEIRHLATLSERFNAVIAIPGNHDFGFEDSGNFEVYRKYAENLGVTILNDTSTTVNGYNIYGSPWQPWFLDWAFNFPNPHTTANGIDHKGEAAYAAIAKWAQIPDDTNILVTHGPPEGILDRAHGYGPQDNRTGCPYLMERITRLESLRLHVFGHIHEQNGQMQMLVTPEGKSFPDWRSDPSTDIGDAREVKFVNAAICDRKEYAPVQEIHVIEL